MSTITRGVLAGISAARLERRGFKWQSSRELEVDEPRWAVKHRHDYGYTAHLPDMVAWRPGREKPIAIVCEEARRREDRQRWQLEGWRDAVNAGRYECVQYDCATEALATWMTKLGEKVRLRHPELRSVVQTPLEQIAALTQVEYPAAKPVVAEATRADTRPQLRLVEDPPPPPAREAAPYTHEARPQAEPAPGPPPETPEEYEARKQRYFEVFGNYGSFEPPEKPKRRRFR